MKRYHAHIYFKEHEILAIKRVKNEAANSPLTVWQLFDHCAGPHSRPMLELHFTEDNHREALRWLRKHRGNFSVLVHENTGDDAKDHLDPLWLGLRLSIDFRFFDQVKNNPELSVHSQTKM